jgi:single-stranded-DNA-specific exonuclease
VGKKFQHWDSHTATVPASFDVLSQILLANRSFEPIDKLNYGDHGLEAATETLSRAIRNGDRIALYADYDVDGTMSCVSWIWFLQSIGFTNFVHYIPCRFKEGYGVNLKAIQHLVENEKAKLVITMDTGITANAEAEYCRQQGVQFICTDHHKIQPEKMPDCTIVNPKLHPSPLYQELCGCGITFVLLRRLAAEFPPPPAVWTDLLALVGMATICDVVPLNAVNHRLARQGVDALLKSSRPILKRLREAAQITSGMDEKDVGFRLGPRINAVGRLGHADQVIEAFVGNDPETLVRYMGTCNEQRKLIQSKIVLQACELAAAEGDAPVLFLGSEEWHTGVVGIAASKIAEQFWRPVWLFQRKDGIGKGSARSLPGFDVTDAMTHAKQLFTKFGGHRAAGGFTFPLEREAEIRAKLIEYASSIKQATPDIWESRIHLDCRLPWELANLGLADILDSMKPFGHGFDEPKFCLEGVVLGVDYYNDKQTGKPRHTAVLVEGYRQMPQKIMFFNEVVEDLTPESRARFVVSASRNHFQGRVSLSLTGYDWDSFSEV